MSKTNPFQTKKSLGQYFLNSSIVPQWMCDAAAVEAGDVVIEVGPGTGIMTAELLAHGARVIAIEADKRAVAILKEKFSDEDTAGMLTIHHADIRTFDLTELNVSDHSYSVVSNIPYYLTGMLFRLFLEHTRQPARLVFLVQKEVAKRATASRQRGEKESLLSLSIKLYGTPKYIRTVPRGHFSPQPNVDSAILAIEDITKSRVADIGEERIFSILHLGFGQKRKQLLGNLSKCYPRADLINIFSTLSIPHDIRAEDLDLDTWLALIQKLPKTKSTL
ncbi:MAG: 16S rRNA (adenine(1518)-N(6)/adenine(1519)-N(6))-dimethyltransferase RsmA [Candidatus Paceibacterota bacterium]